MIMKQNTPGFFPAKVPGGFIGSNIDFWFFQYYKIYPHAPVRAKLPRSGVAGFFTIGLPNCVGAVGVG